MGEKLIIGYLVATAVVMAAVLFISLGTLRRPGRNWQYTLEDVVHDTVLFGITWPLLFTMLLPDTCLYVHRTCCHRTQA